VVQNQVSLAAPGQDPDREREGAPVSTGLTTAADRQSPGLRDRPARRLRLPSDALRYAAPAILVYAGLRAVSVAIFMVWGHFHGQPALNRLATLWDAQWYWKIAHLGYAGVPPQFGPHGQYEMYAFFPAYPGAIRAVWTVLPVSWSQAALITAWLASLFAAWGIFAVAARIYTRRVGVLAVALWAVLPVAAVESMAYSELIFTAFCAWAIYFVLADRWLTAALFSVLAGLTRPTGAAVAAAVGIAALWELWRRRAAWRTWWRPVVAGLVAPAGFAGYIVWVGYVKGHWDAYFKIQEAWDSKFDFGKSTLDHLNTMLGTGGPVWLADAVVAVVLLVSVILLGVSVIQRQPLVLLVFSTVIMTLAIGDAAYFNCRARFLLPAFGLLFPIAAGLGRVRKTATLVFVLVCAAAMSGLYGCYLVFVFHNAP
jgi:hypothetical protein